MLLDHRDGVYLKDLYLHILPTTLTQKLPLQLGPLFRFNTDVPVSAIQETAVRVAEANIQDWIRIRQLVKFGKRGSRNIDSPSDTHLHTLTIDDRRVKQKTGGYSTMEFNQC